MDMVDGKAPDALRTIGEVASALGIRQHVLRYWEEQFPMLRPLKRSGGRRYYRPDDVELVRTIDRLVHHEGYTLRGARQLLQGKPAVARRTPAAAALPPEPPMLEPIVAESHEGVADSQPVAIAASPVRAPVINGLRELRDRLAAALAAA